MRLTWVEAAFASNGHILCQALIVRHQQQGSTGWTWSGTFGSSTTSRTLDLDRSGDYTVEVIAYVYPSWRTWNSATIKGRPGDDSPGTSSLPRGAPPTRGVIYLVAGPKSYLGELSTSLSGLRRHHPDLPVTVFSPYPVPRGLDADHVEYDSALHPLQQKVDVLRRSPYRETLFLDTDTNILGPFVEVFDLADGGQLRLGKGLPMGVDRHGEQRLELEHPEQFNTGVLCFDSSEATRAFLDRWFETVFGQDPTDMWPGHNCDQTWFNRLVAEGVPQECGMSMTVLRIASTTRVEPWRRNCSVVGSGTTSGSSTIARCDEGAQGVVLPHGPRRLRRRVPPGGRQDEATDLGLTQSYSGPKSSTYLRSTAGSRSRSYG